MNGVGQKLLTACGIEPRSFVALVYSFIVMDLRGQHFAQATATKPHYVISPLFWVVGQCLTLSAVTSLLLFARVDVFFFAFVGLGLSWLMTGVLLLVEFDEVVLAPRDADILGPRPIPPRTLAAARLANLGYYVGLIWLAMNIFPLIVGAGLRDAGWMYAPTYLLASLSGTCVVVALVVVLVSLVPNQSDLEMWKNLLAWTQIILILVVGYGGQFMLRDESFRVQVWAAFPPDCVGWLPPAWLGRFVEHATVAVDASTLAVSLILVAAAAMAISLTLHRLVQATRLGPARSPGGASSAVVSSHPATMMSWWLRQPEERAGFWLCRIMLRRDGNFLMRCLLPFHLPAALLLLALLVSRTGFTSDDLEKSSATLAILSVYTVAFAVATAMYQLSSCRDFRGGWLLRGATGPAARGAAKALVLFVATPACVLLGIGWHFFWGDALTSMILFLVAWALCWPAALAGLWLLLPATPFSLSPIRGGALGLPPLPLAGLGVIVGTLTALHLMIGTSILLGVALVVAAVAGSYVLSLAVHHRLLRMDRTA